METNRFESSPQDRFNPLQPVFDFLRGDDPDVVCARHGITRADLDKRVSDYQASRRQAALEDHLITQRVGRNDPCPCGSGKKYKKCCLSKHTEARQHLPADKLQEMQTQAKAREKLDKALQQGFEALFSRDYGKAQQMASRLLESYPEDDRLHDILVSVAFAGGDYDSAFHTSRRRWQVAQEEKAFYNVNGYHKREGLERQQLVHFYSPSTWLEKFWIAQRARAYRDQFPRSADARLAKLAEGLRVADDTQRFPGRQEEGFEARRQALAPLLEELRAEGEIAIPYLLPLTYTFSWASLFVPDLLQACGTDACLRLLAELSMFRFPYFSQQCLSYLEGFGERAVPHVVHVISENPVFDELKVGLIAVLGQIPTAESFQVLLRLLEHENPYVVSWAVKALERHGNPEAEPHLEKAKKYIESFDEIAGVMQELAKLKEA